MKESEKKVWKNVNNIFQFFKIKSICINIHDINFYCLHEKKENGD